MTSRFRRLGDYWPGHKVAHAPPRLVEEFDADLSIPSARARVRIYAEQIVFATFDSVWAADALLFAVATIGDADYELLRLKDGRFLLLDHREPPGLEPVYLERAA